VTGDWAAHRARGSLGGIDWATPTGTPLYAPSDGIADFRFYGDGSSVIRIRRADNTRTEFLHGTFLGGNFRPVKAGERVGTSDGRRGTRGAGRSTGPHVHAHDVTAAGVRVPPFSTIPNIPDESIAEEKEDDMLVFISEKGDDAVRVTGGGYRYRFETVNEFEAFRNVLEASGHTVPPIVQVDSSWSANLMWNAAVKSGSTAAAAPSGGAYNGPTANQIAAEVIRQQKLPGN
jgi:hypothetical protein